MGLCNYYRKLYQDFRSYVPINKFMADHCRWQEEQEKASEIPKEKINGKLIGVVGSFQKKLIAAQLNYFVMEREFLAIIESLKQFRFILRSYHLSLSYIMSQVTKNRIARW